MFELCKNWILFMLTLTFDPRSMIQVLQLHKELLLMGELQGKYETKLHVIRNSHHSKPEQENMIATLRAENKGNPLAL